MKLKLFLSTFAYAAISFSLQAVTVEEVRNYFYETAENPAMPVVFPAGQPAYFVKAETAELLEALVHNTPLGKNGTTPLDVAAQTFNTGWLSYLLNYNSSFYTELKSFHSFIEDIKGSDCHDCKLPFENLAGVISQPLDASGNTALHLAVSANNPSLVQSLCEYGASPNKKNVAQDLPMTLAIRGPLKKEVFDILIEYINPNERSSLGNLFGHLLAYYKDDNAAYALEKLAEKGMTISENAVYGDTPLHGAAWIQNTAMIKKLRMLGASCNIQNHYGRTPFHAAAMSGDKATIDALLKFESIDTSLTDRNGNKPSDVAANSWIANYLREKNL